MVDDNNNNNILTFMNGVTLLSQHYKNYVNYIKNVAKSKMFTYIKT